MVRTSVFGWRTFPDLCLIYRVAQKKVSHHQFFKKIVLKIANEIDFFVKLKYEAGTVIQSVGNILCVTYFCDVINNARPAK